MRRSAFIAMIVLAPVVAAQSASDILDVRSEGTLSPREIESFAAPLFDGFQQPEALYPVSVYEMFVFMEYPGDRVTPVRVQLFVPETGDTIPHAAYLFAPGSTGLINPCRASREHVAGIRWGLYRAHVLSVASRGLVGILPDYPGFEDATLTQPYFHAYTEAATVFSVFRAVDRWLDDRFPDGISSMTRVAGGFSQGGHAAFAAADYNAELSGYLPLDGVIGYGPSTDIAALFLEYPGVAPMLVQSFSRIYGADRFDPFRILQGRWADRLEFDTTRQCVGGMQAYYPHDADQLFSKAFIASLRTGSLSSDYPEIDRIIRENTPGLSDSAVPALVLQGTNDIVVSVASQTRFVEMMRERGRRVRYIVYDGARHDTRQIAFFDTLAWIDSLGDRRIRRSVDANPADSRLD